MMNDSVREELETKISISASPNRRNFGEIKPNPAPTTSPKPMRQSPEPARQPQITAPPPVPMPILKPPPAQRMLTKPAPMPARPPQTKSETAAIAPKQTSPTLVGFQAKNAVLPDWRLQVQNSVRQRANPRPEATEAAEERRPFATNGANALKAEPFIESEIPPHQNPRVANALRRIEASRRTFLSDEPADRAFDRPKQSVPVKDRPFNLVSPTEKPANSAATVPATMAAPKPKLVSAMRIEKKKYDTNKLPQIPDESAIVNGHDRVAETRLAHLEIGSESPSKIVRPARPIFETAVAETETDDLAPLAMRFNATLFDLIIGGFGGLAALSPFIVSGGNWMSLPGVLAIAGGVSLVLFLYLTISLGVYGQTFGMRLFALELIDADENEYPTLHQAAVHSAVFILSLASAGLGFLPILFNEERRAAHDLVSGTVLVREY